MGIHYVLGYTGYEEAFTNTFLHLIDNYCTGCHTNKDVGDDCKKCPIGNLLMASKEYILNAFEPPQDKKETRILRKLKEQVRKIQIYPGMNNCSWLGNYHDDKLEKIRELKKQLSHINEQRIINFDNYREAVKRVMKQLENKKSVHSAAKTSKTPKKKKK